MRWLLVRPPPRNRVGAQAAATQYIESHPTALPPRGIIIEAVPVSGRFPVSLPVVAGYRAGLLVLGQARRLEQMFEESRLELAVTVNRHRYSNVGCGLSINIGNSEFLVGRDEAVRCA